MILFLGCFVVFLVSLGNDWAVPGLASVGACIVIVIVQSVSFIKAHRPSKEDQDRMKEKRQADRDAMAKAAAEAGYRKTRIVDVKLLDGGSVDYKRGGLGGAALGGFIAGPLGAVVGAAMPKGRGTQRQRFAVKYGDGRVEIKELHPNDWQYKDLMNYVKWEDIR